MIRPDDEDLPFVARWNALIRSLLIEPSVKLVARTAADYADFTDGSSCHPGNARLMRDTGYSDKTIRTAWATLRGMGLAVRVAVGNPAEGEADEYVLQIPDDWKRKPLLGPRGKAFRCLYCHKRFNPQPNSRVNEFKTDRSGDDAVRFKVFEFTFCPTPRKSAGCYELWTKARAEAGETPWPELGQKVWELFRESRGDDW